jgi:hypothetical protein
MPAKYRLYKALPKEFTINEAEIIGNLLKISRSTIYRYVHQFAEGDNGKGLLIEKSGHGTYRKTMERDD